MKTRHPFMPLAEFNARPHSPKSAVGKKLVAAYAEISRLTGVECGLQCGECDVSPQLHLESPTRCCSDIFCEMTRQWALDVWGVVLEDTGHPTVPFMGAIGCAVAPHLRPLCSVYSCHIERGRGGLANPAADQRYSDLMKLICKLEGVQYKADGYGRIKSATEFDDRR